MIDQNKNTKKNRLKNLSLTSLGWELAVPIFGGLLIGYRIDKYFNTGYTFTLVLLLVGVFMGYYSLYKYIELEMLRKKVLDRRKEKEDITS